MRWEVTSPLTTYGSAAVKASMSCGVTPVHTIAPPVGGVAQGARHGDVAGVALSADPRQVSLAVRATALSHVLDVGVEQQVVSRYQPWWRTTYRAAGSPDGPGRYASLDR